MQWPLSHSPENGTGNDYQVPPDRDGLDGLVSEPSSTGCALLLRHRSSSDFYSMAVMPTKIWIWMNGTQGNNWWKKFKHNIRNVRLHKLKVSIKIKSLFRRYEICNSSAFWHQFTRYFIFPQNIMSWFQTKSKGLKFPQASRIHKMSCFHFIWKYDWSQTKSIHVSTLVGATVTFNLFTSIFLSSNYRRILPLQILECSYHFIHRLWKPFNENHSVSIETCIVTSGDWWWWYVCCCCCRCCFQSMSMRFIVCKYFSVKFLYLNCVECVYNLYIEV